VQAPQYLKGWMEEEGFVDVKRHILKLPVGHWPKDPRLKKVGLFEGVNIQEGIDALSLRLFSGALKWSPEEVQMLLMDARKQARDKDVHSYYLL
jgi:hypothetical protein